jgi:hypothetical protein
VVDPGYFFCPCSWAEVVPGMGVAVSEGASVDLAGVLAGSAEA